ncbi:hypothetical protein CBM2585_A10062 [Cupriavidus taiwanensis]|nr:hypothetical protein CBM2585_A10062 [Cupriavidus taiwanensis]
MRGYDAGAGNETDYFLKGAAGCRRVERD